MYLPSNSGEGKTAKLNYSKITKFKTAKFNVCKHLWFYRKRKDGIENI